jgi:hypothetical protein
MAVATLESIYDKYGYELLDRVIKLIVITWEGENKSFSSNVMNGLARLLYVYGENIKDEIFKDKLGEISVKEISKTARERRAGSLGFAEAMLIYYNKKMKAPLQWNLLYINKAEKARRNKELKRKGEEIPSEE